MTNYCSLTEKPPQSLVLCGSHPLSGSLFTNTVFKRGPTCRSHLKGNTWKPRLCSWGNLAEKDWSNQGHTHSRGQEQTARSSSPHAFSCLQRLLIRVLLLEISVLLGILLLNHFSLFPFSSLSSGWGSVLKPRDYICQRDKQHCRSEAEYEISSKK